MKRGFLNLRLFNSFTEDERLDYAEVRTNIDNCIGNKRKIAFVCDDPYLLLLGFTSLIRYNNIEIHLLNIKEGIDEVQRLAYTIQPELIIFSDSYIKEQIKGFDKLLLTGDMKREKMVKNIVEENVDFKVFYYSPSPIKITSLSSNHFENLIDSIIYDMYKFNILNESSFKGLMSICTNSSDYLLYYIAIKLINNKLTLPGEDEYDWCIFNKKQYFQANKSDTLIIPSEELLSFWEDRVLSIYEKKLFFKLSVKFPKLSNYLLRRRFQNLLKGYKRILVINNTNNQLLNDSLKSLHGVDIYSIIPLKTVLCFGSISKSLDSFIITTNLFKQDYFVELNRVSGESSDICQHHIRIIDPNSKESTILADINNYFIEDEPILIDGENRKRFLLLGDKDNLFTKDYKLIFPEALEKVINSYPFIKYSALLTYHNLNYIIVVPYADMLDANKINYEMFSEILRKQKDLLNKQLPEEYKISEILHSRELIRRNRFGEISRFALNSPRIKGGSN